jgi:hypothetical protein
MLPNAECTRHPTLHRSLIVHHPGNGPADRLGAGNPVPPAESVEALQLGFRDFDDRSHDVIMQRHHLRGVKHPDAALVGDE